MIGPAQRAGGTSAAVLVHERPAGRCATLSPRALCQYLLDIFSIHRRDK